ncbi:MAG TPA: hypothetical protein VEK57_11735 [Thermoanaerobaculia bacterium]|nr:hypothetical protein [Thermoanaerobaculia bacterium]
MTPKQRRWVFIFAGLGGLMGIASFAFVIWLTVRSVTNPLPPTADEKLLVLNAKALEPFGYEDYNPAAESLTVLRQFGTRTIQYGYDSREMGEDEDPVVISSITEVHPQALNAVQSYQMQKVGVKAGVAFAGDAKIVDAPALLRNTADEGYAALLKNESYVGNIFIIRQGRAIHTITIAGYYFDDPQEVKKLLGPLLAESKKQMARR